MTGDGSGEKKRLRIKKDLQRMIIPIKADPGMIDMTEMNEYIFLIL